MSQTKAQLLDPQGDFTLTGHLLGVGATFSGNLDVTGNVSIAGTLTKQDVTNVDSVGVITARSGVNIGANGSITSGANFILSGNKFRVTGADTVGIECQRAGNATIQCTDTTSSTDLQLRANSEGGLVRTATNFPLILGTNQAERLRIASDGKIGIGKTDPAEKLDVAGAIQANSSGLKLDTHPLVTYASFTAISGGTYAARLGSTGTSTIRSTQIYGGGSPIATFDGVNTRLGIGSEAPQATLDVNGSFINSNSVNSTGDAGIQVSNGHRLGFDESGTRSWTVKATGGNLEVQSGDGNGSLKGASNGGVHDSKGNVRSVPQNTQGSAYTLVVGDAGKHILASQDVTVQNSIFTVGDMVTIVNNTAGAIQIVKAINDMYWTQDGTDVTRTLATRGMATILFTSSSQCYISGSGLS